MESQAARGKLRGITDKSSYIKILQQEDVSGYPLVSNPPCNGGTWVGELRSQMPVRRVSLHPTRREAPRVMNNSAITQDYYFA